ncbi:MAG: hypothetical protein ACLQL2_03020 [Methylovirgula sp.]
MTFGDRFFSLLLYATGVLFVAALVHIVAILVMPQVAPRDAYTRLAVFAKPGQMTLLPRPLPGHQLTPFEDPAVAQAVCLYDLASGPLHLHADLPDNRLLTVSFRTRTGQVFYSMTDRASLHGTIDVRIMTQPQLDAEQENDDDDNDQPLKELRLVAPDTRGFVLVNALSTHPSERADTEAEVKSVSCAPETLAQN